MTEITFHKDGRIEAPDYYEIGLVRLRVAGKVLRIPKATALYVKPIISHIERPFGMARPPDRFEGWDLMLPGVDVVDGRLEAWAKSEPVKGYDVPPFVYWIMEDVKWRGNMSGRCDRQGERSCGGWLYVPNIRRGLRDFKKHAAVSARMATP